MPFSPYLYLCRLFPYPAHLSLSVSRKMCDSDILFQNLIGFQIWPARRFPGKGTLNNPIQVNKNSAVYRGGQNDTFYLWPFRSGGGGGDWVQGQICQILTPASYETLPAPSGHTDSHTLDAYIWIFKFTIQTSNASRTIQPHFLMDSSL
jgi:hypothetical protein